ncbi:hypothetical protein DPMN_002744 [Dreissena polymorpha]|uniref:Uncharacterized protein n=1 Tax=Dreissena polymorpha TaxID=45954 RepID=A0A9D4MNF3_DREPO|nr:hypothetical protein DPMN_002744 [Dreissena polymorpha]
MLFSNNVNLRPGEQYAIDTIQQKLFLAILRFGVATSASGLAPSLSMAQSQQQQQQQQQEQ